MKFSPLLIVALFTSLFFFESCTSTTLDESLLIGDWKGISWEIENGSDQNADNLSFRFVEDGTYEATFGNAIEKGSYRLAGDKLYTTETGKIEKMVKIVQLTSDSLAFEMNRVGTAEKISLIRK